MKQQEKEQIYQEWLAGAWIADLARKYHHWRSTIERVVTEQAAASCPASEFKTWVEHAKSLKQQVERLRLVCMVNRAAMIAILHGKKAKKRWCKDLTESCKALDAKARALGAGEATLVHVYDDYGIPLDVVPFRPEQAEAAMAEEG
jgi:CRP-like cAMP-binding protein